MSESEHTIAPTQRRSKRFDGILLVACLSLTTVLSTWPLAMHLEDALPLGSERSATIPYFNLWTLGWNADRLAHGYDDYWNAPIFHPTPGTFALSDPQPLTGVAFAALRGVVGGDVVAYNLLFLAVVLANGLAAAWVARGMGCGTAASLLTGVLAQFLPVLAAEAGVFQLVGIAPALVSVGLCIRLSRRPRIATGVALGCALAVTFLTSEYYGVYTGLLLLPGGLLFLERRSRRRHGLALIVGAGVAAIFVVPFAALQSAHAVDHDRSTRSLEKTSARTFDYAALPQVTLGGRKAPWLSDRPDLRVGLYPGTALLVLAAAGLLLSLRSRPRRRVAIYLACAALAAFLLSLGPRIDGGVAGPYRLLHDHVPGFDKMRNTYRFAVPAQTFLLLLAALGLRELFRRGRTQLATACVLLGLIEVLPIPRPLVRAPEAVPDTSWTHDLARLPHGPAVALPFPESKRASAYVRTVVDMLDGLEHRKPLLNGYSGFLPRVHREDYPAFEDFPDADWLSWCRERGVRYVILDDRWLREHHPEFVVPPSLEPVAGDPRRTVYELATFFEVARRHDGTTGVSSAAK